MIAPSLPRRFGEGLISQPEPWPEPEPELPVEPVSLQGDVPFETQAPDRPRGSPSPSPRLA